MCALTGALAVCGFVVQPDDVCGRLYIVVAAFFLKLTVQTCSVGDASITSQCRHDSSE